MDKYQISLEELKKMLERKATLTEKEWDEYAKKSNCFSSFTMQAHKNVYSWQQLKKSLNERDKKLDKKIEKTRKELHVVIEKYGLASGEAIDINNEMNELTIIYNKNEEYRYIEKGRIYQNGSSMYEAYVNSYMELEKITKNSRRFPTVKEWNQHAQKYDFLSNQSIEYIIRTQLE